MRSGPCDRRKNHAIRRQAIFAVLLPGRTYDETDPDEVAPRNFPHVMRRDGEIVGVIRIDLIGPSRAGLRLVGIRSDLQRQGYGRILLRLAEGAARRLGKTEIIINAHPTSLAFYLANVIAKANGRTPYRSLRLSFAWGSDCVDRAPRRSPTAGLSSTPVVLPSQLPQIVPNPRH